MNRKHLKTICFLVCALIFSTVSTHGQDQKTHSNNESLQRFDEVRNPEEVRRSVESKPYNKSLEEGRRQGKSQIRKDLDELKLKASNLRPKWLTENVALIIGKVLLLAAVAVYMIMLLQRREKKKAMKKLKNIPEDAQKHR